MAEKSKNRQNPRYQHQSPITREDIKTGIQRGAQMFNYSKGGLYFEAEYVLEPGDEIFIGIENSPYASSPGVYECFRVKVKWRKKIENKNSAFCNGYGIQFYYPDQIFLTTIYDNIDNTDLQHTAFKQKNYSREYVREHWAKKIIFSTQNRFHEGFIKDISRKGAFIETNGVFSTGQRLSLAIPLANGRKGVKLRGEVVWSNQKGFGCEFKEKI